MCVPKELLDRLHRAINEFEATAVELIEEHRCVVNAKIHQRAECYGLMPYLIVDIMQRVC